MPKLTGPVLVVDDDEAVRDSLKFVLELEGLQVRLYAGAAQLLRDVALPTDGCLLVDYRMPDMDGLELVARLRARNVALPAILITGRLSGDLGRLAADAGFRRVVEKPFEDGSLLEGIHEALALHPDDWIGLRKTP
ncbi:response regulator transcription factor [Methylobacterium radiotolerans]|uniref:Response regulator receiver protein n=1 Tax=Methylobacterium radiotolerans (strain ATCC 27329 / DSM 1819 / JCM 2831 / NBRC 15690 / NCIMB 10815 / 0-1) TaxID=426355 RepID=B1M7V2_METRJ|nr:MULTISPECIES: response regulator [Methylobacterium]ACB25255.1 response regulator receiver protein [Methylobacterium radiotolerans JCM 2831]MBY0254227.1 response regulator [Methylobacterium organophilum]MDE3747456.1 response regulator [Methylobacterium radiotolerans]PVY87308.1 response regulator receiver domain-containing protein [Methylobacterium organophilum]UIY40147.1 response regulator [Methylobacterium radiotolerans]